MHTPETIQPYTLTMPEAIQPVVDSQRSSKIGRLILRGALAIGFGTSSIMGVSAFAAEGDNRGAPAVVADMPYFADTHLDCGPVITAHRGTGKLGSAENTIPGLRSGLRIGADAVEFDVRKSKDGKLLIIHNPTMNASTNMNGPVAEKPYWKIRQAKTNNGSHVPLLLEEVLPAVANYGSGDRKAQFDLKVPLTPNDVENIVNRVEELGLHDRVIFASTQPNRARKFSELGYPTGYILPTGVWKDLSTVPDFFDTINADRETATPLRVERAAKAGFGTLERHIYSKANTREVMRDKGAIVMSDNIKASVAACN